MRFPILQRNTMAACMDQRGFQRLQAPVPLSPMLLRRRRALKYIDTVAKIKFTIAIMEAKYEQEKGDKVVMWLRFGYSLLIGCLIWL